MDTIFHREKYPQEMKRVANFFRKKTDDVTDEEIATYNQIHHKTRYGTPLHGIPCKPTFPPITVITSHGFEDNRR